MSRNGAVTTSVGRVKVPLRLGSHPSLGVFVGGARGAHEKGQFFFWTAVLKQRRLGYRTVTVRTRALNPPGERFSRFGVEQRTARRAGMRAANGDIWTEVLRRGENIVYIRPATEREMRRWCATHLSDAQHLVYWCVGPPRRPAVPKPAEAVTVTLAPTNPAASNYERDRRGPPSGFRPDDPSLADGPVLRWLQRLGAWWRRLA